MKGKLIVISGTDGSGKGTQTDLLVQRLKDENYPVKITDFPQYGQKSAGMVEEYLNGKFGTADEVGPYRASIFYACDRYEASFRMHKWLKEGNIIVSNRYVSANMGHQAGKIQNLKERDEYLGWLENLEYNIFGIPRPDKNLLLYMPADVAQKLVDQKGHRDYVGGHKRDIHEADLNHLQNAASAYKYVAQKYDWTTINCAKDEEPLTRETIHEMVWNEVKKLI
jgi:dTMP kinase